MPPHPFSLLRMPVNFNFFSLYVCPVERIVESHNGNDGCDDD